MNLITLFTPTHTYNREYLHDIANSLVSQTYQRFEWLILLNGKCFNERKRFELLKEEFPTLNIRVEVEEDRSNWNKIGALKARCCELAVGTILFELDHDDYLAPEALQEVIYAFQVESVQFAYSNTIEFFYPKPTEGPICNVYSDYYGWKSELLPDGYTQLKAFKPTPHSIRRIEWAPNHLRAFRATAYHHIGGYNKAKRLGDDHDIMCRFYLEYGEQGFYHIDKPLYYYRVHTGNTSNSKNDVMGVQEVVAQNYIEFAEKMYMKWAKDEGLECLDLGGRFNCPEGYKSVDLLDADIICNLEKSWDNIADNSVGVLRAYHVLEHLRDSFKVGADGELELLRNGVINFFNEAFRVLAPGGFLLIEVPSIQGSGAVSDPTHVRFFNLRSFEYFYNNYLARFIKPSYTGKFQCARINEYFWEGTNVSVISCHLIALKGWYEDNWCGEKLM